MSKLAEGGVGDVHCEVQMAKRRKMPPNSRGEAMFLRDKIRLGPSVSGVLPAFNADIPTIAGRPRFFFDKNRRLGEPMSQCKFF